MRVMNQEKATENVVIQQILFTAHITLNQTVREENDTDKYWTLKMYQTLC